MELGHQNFNYRGILLKMSEAPKQEGPVTPGVESASTLAKIEELDREIGHLKKTNSLVRGTNWAVLIVLFVAVLALIFAAIYSFKQSVDNNNNNELEIRKSLQELQIKYENLEAILQKNVKMSN